MESISSNPDLFEDVCDDVCAQILGYLPFKDKIKLEGVSKQWQRCIYEQQTVIILNSEEQRNGKNTLNKLLKTINVYDYGRGVADLHQFKEIKKQEFENVLKRCPDIRTVELMCYVDDNDLQIISENVEKLESFECNMFGITEKGLIEFGLICGQMLKTLTLNNSLGNTAFIRKYLRLCPNITNISTDKVSQFIIEDESFLPKLEAIQNFYMNSEERDIELLRIISKKYCNTMKNFDIIVREDIGRRSVQYINYFVNLQELYLRLYGFEQNDENQPNINHYIEKISENCRQLKHFVFIVFDRNNNLPLNLLQSFSKFNSITSLNISILETDKQIECKCEFFKSCTYLKHLNLSYKEITDHFFENIGQHIANLRSIIIVTEKQLSDQAIKSMAVLKKLKKFHIFQYRNSNQLITDIGVCQLINSCNDIEDMYFTSRPKISNATIDCLIAIALQRNRKSIKFRCDLSEARDELQFEQQIDINRLNDLPHNLKIVIAID